MWVVGILYKKGVVDPLGKGTLGDIMDLGIGSINAVRTIGLYFISGSVSEEGIERVCNELLVDRQVQECRHVQGDAKRIVGGGDGGTWAVEVRLKKGVTDAVGKSVEKGIGIIEVEGVDAVSTGTIYLLGGQPTEQELESVCKRILANPIIQDYSCWEAGA